MWEEGQGGMGMGLRVVCLAYQRKSSEVEKRYYVFFLSNLFTRMVSSVKFSSKEKSREEEEKVHVPHFSLVVE